MFWLPSPLAQGLPDLPTRKKLWQAQARPLFFRLVLLCFSVMLRDLLETMAPPGPMKSESKHRFADVGWKSGPDLTSEPWCMVVAHPNCNWRLPEDSSKHAPVISQSSCHGAESRGRDPCESQCYQASRRSFAFFLMP